MYEYDNEFNADEALLIEAAEVAVNTALAGDGLLKPYLTKSEMAE